MTNVLFVSYIMRMKTNETRIGSCDITLSDGARVTDGKVIKNMVDAIMKDWPDCEDVGIINWRRYEEVDDEQ